MSKPKPTSLGIHDLRGLYLRLTTISMIRSMATESCAEFFRIVRKVSSLSPPFFSHEQISAKVRCVTAANIAMAFLTSLARSEERRVGKEGNVEGVRGSEKDRAKGVRVEVSK